MCVVNFQGLCRQSRGEACGLCTPRLFSEGSVKNRVALVLEQFEALIQVTWRQSVHDKCLVFLANVYVLSVQ